MRVSYLLILILFLFSVSIVIAAEDPTVDFSANRTNGTAPLTVKFRDETKDNSITLRYWEFGDATTNITEKKHVLHTYTTPAIYTVSLTITNESGNFKCTKPGHIVVTGYTGMVNITVLDPAAVVAVKPVFPNGTIGNPINITTSQPVLIPPIPAPMVVKLEIIKPSETIEKLALIFPEVDVIISENATILLQSTTTGNESTNTPVLELYYGYGQSAFAPWDYYYRVDSINCTTCKAVHAEFSTKTVWIENVNATDVLDIVNARIIPGYETLP